MSETVKWWRKTTIANVVAGASTIIALLFFIYVKDAEKIATIITFMLGYLYGTRKK